MALQARAAGLPAVMLLLWTPGCVTLSGPGTVTGTVGRSLSVQCRYEEQFREHAKYWCQSRCLLPSDKIVETGGPEREGRSGRVSIRDDPANLTFTVTLERLRKDDEGTYLCAINKEFSLDPKVEVTVLVSPAPKPVPSTHVPVTKTSTVTREIPTVSSTTTLTVSSTHRASSQEEVLPDQSPWLQVLLSSLALLLFLLVGLSLLAWGMIRRRVKAGKNPEHPRRPSQAAQPSEPCYANLELQMGLLRAEPVHPRPAEVEYCELAAPKEDLHYTTVVFSVQNQDRKTHGMPSQRPEQEPEYSVLKT